MIRRLFPCLFHSRPFGPEYGVSCQVFKNGTSQAQANQGDATIINAGADAGGFRVGGDTGTGRYWKGHIAEIIHYNRALTAGEITSIKTYISTKYGLTIA